MSNRLLTISQIDPEWACMIYEFVSSHPEFEPYIYLAPITRKPVSNYNFSTIREAIFFYICFAGVYRNNANMYWTQVQKIKTIDELESSSLPPKKKSYLKEAWTLSETLTLTEFKNMKIKGIGISGITFIIRYFSTDINEYMNLTEHTDTGLLKGLQFVYQLEKQPTPTQAKKIIDKWTCYKAIGNALCCQVFNHILD
jgi:hypothetical protein